MDPKNNKSCQKLNLTQCIGGEGGVCVYTSKIHAPKT